MKNLHPRKRTLLCFFALALAGSLAWAQMPSVTPNAGLNAGFIKLFGNATAFTAKVDAQVLDKEKVEWVRMPMDFAALDGKVRVEVNMEQIKSKNLPPSVTASFKQAGMDRVLSIIRPDKNATYVIYPGARSYLNMPSEKEEAPEKLKLEKEPLGKETIDGHACVKNKVTVRNQQGTALQATMWNASDLQDFPVQIETQEKDNTMVMRFKDIHFAKPDAKQFDLPVGFTEYKDAQEMMMALAKKMLGGEESK